MPKLTLQVEAWEYWWILGCAAPQENTDCPYIYMEMQGIYSEMQGTYY